MSTLNVQGASLYYELSGDPANPPVPLVAGLGGTSKSWSTQTGRFAKDHYVILPDHRGTGQSSRTLEGHTTKQLAADMAALIEHLGVGPVHVIGSSTGGTIAQYMALDHQTHGSDTHPGIHLCPVRRFYEACVRGTAKDGGGMG